MLVRSLLVSVVQKNKKGGPRFTSKTAGNSNLKLRIAKGKKCNL